ncbi:hypothetical protein OPT61_g7338 [Boeremia exigua]|uniref:Uncharacterized protein n=1 Tax=Boeremia exigua TaxID=749465 RepID=A0ACC2I3N5_9PLEO|nr:hypothetical protein OPT61_g7338 [Boeremia exigua]
MSTTQVIDTAGACHVVSILADGTNSTITGQLCTSSAPPPAGVPPVSTASQSAPNTAAAPNNAAASSSAAASEGQISSNVQQSPSNTIEKIGAPSSAVISQPSSANPSGVDSSPSVTANPQPPIGTKGLTGGAVAGVAIGMLLAGILFAGIIFFFLLRRQKKRQAASAATYSRQHAAYSNRQMGPEKGATVTATAVGSIDELLPQPVEDEAITGDLSKIRDNIKNHVRTYYHSGPSSTADADTANVQEIAALTGTSAAMLVHMIFEPTKRDNALRSIIAALVLTRCTGERSPNLLPGELAALSTSIPASNSSNAQLLLVSKWKTITGALLHERQRQDPSRSQGFQDTITSLDAILAPLVKSGVDGVQRQKNLEMILTRAANFAFLLFRQPGSFRFDFASRQGRLTVFPALVQIVGDQGQLLSPAKPLTEREDVGE